MVVVEIKSKDEYDEILQNNKIVIVDFTATWCGPCKAIKPKLEEWSEEFPGAFYAAVDVDECPDIAQENGIRAMPTIVVFQDGDKVGDVLGANPPGILRLIQAHATGE